MRVRDYFSEYLNRKFVVFSRNELPLFEGYPSELKEFQREILDFEVSNADIRESIVYLDCV